MTINDKEGNKNRFIDLLFSSEGQKAYSYLKSRNISDELIRKLDLGWCPLNDDYYSLRGRFTVPLKDIAGKTLAFAGRVPTFKNEEGQNISLYTQSQSMLNWWHEGFPYLNKSNYLYGLNNAYKDIYDKEFAIIVEGEFDLWALMQNNIHNVICVLGSALTIYQVSMLRKFCNKIIVLFDGDTAGEKGWGLVKDRYIGKFDMNFFQLKLPYQYDPCSFVEEYGAEPIKNSVRELLNG